MSYVQVDVKFQPTRPLRGATTSSPKQPKILNFNPRAPCGARLLWIGSEIRFSSFQPTRPLRGATLLGWVSSLISIFQPTRPLRGATKNSTASRGIFLFQPTRPLRGATIIFHLHPKGHGISTHAPLAGRDIPKTAENKTNKHFNPRAPCGARPSFVLICIVISSFQPTRPLRGATLICQRPITVSIFQPTRPLRGATALSVKAARGKAISTHAPLAGRD